MYLENFGGTSQKNHPVGQEDVQKVFNRGELDVRTLGKEEYGLVGFFGSKLLLLEAGTGPVLVLALATCTLCLPGQELQLTSTGTFFLTNN